MSYLIVTLKNEPLLTLGNLLKRKKMTLKQFLDEFGITTYSGLVSRCDRIGVLPPTEDDFKKLNNPIVSNPAEGVVVVEITPQKEKRQRKKKEIEDA